MSDNINNNKKVKTFNGIEEIFAIEDMGFSDGNLSLPSAEVYNYWFERKRRNIFLIKEIDDSLFQDIQTIIQFNRMDDEAGLKPEEREPCRIFINSPGGNLDACMSMINIMEISTTPIYCYALNMAYSAAGMIFINGHKRFALKNANILLHSGSSGSSNMTFEQNQSASKNYKRLVDMMKENILEKTKIPKTILNKKMKEDWYLTKEEMEKYGIVDKFITDMSEITGIKV